MTTRCKQCRERVADALNSLEELGKYCQTCRSMKRIDSHDMPVIPVYTLEELNKIVQSQKLILTRSGLMQLGKIWRMRDWKGWDE